MIEREHKYLVSDNSYLSMASKSYRIRQGYLSRNPESTVRIRIRDNEAFLTVKGITDGDRRQEFEYSIPESDAEKMLKLCSGKIIDKTRYIVNYEGFIWEVDIFEGDLSPLAVAEIELGENESNYPLPPFVGENVTGNPLFYNSNL